MISDVLTYTMEARGWRPAHLAARLQDRGFRTSEQTVGRWMRGDIAPRLVVIPAIAEILDISCDTLLTGSSSELGEEN